MVELGLVGSPKQIKTLSASTVAFTACFSVWTIFSIIGVQLKADLGLNDTQFGLLIGTPILTGSLSRILLGVWAEQYGGRIVYLSVMLCASLATFLLSFADTFSLTLLAALGVGVPPPASDSAQRRIASSEARLSPFICGDMREI